MLRSEWKIKWWKPSRNMFKMKKKMKFKLYYQYYDLINPNLVVSWWRRKKQSFIYEKKMASTKNKKRKSKVK